MKNAICTKQLTIGTKNIEVTSLTKFAVVYIKYYTLIIATAIFILSYMHKTNKINKEAKPKNIQAKTWLL